MNPTGTVAAPVERSRGAASHWTIRHLVRALTGLRVWSSTDAGETWKEAKVRRSHGRDTFAVSVNHPPLHRTDGYVWLRADASDLAGSRVEQTIERAYALR